MRERVQTTGKEGKGRKVEKGTDPFGVRTDTHYYSSSII